MERERREDEFFLLEIQEKRERKYFPKNF